MSSPAEIIDGWYANMVANYSANAAAVFMIYDYLLNTGREVEVFWRRPITTASVLFFSNKCMTLLKHFLDWLTPLGTSDKSCSRLIIADFVVEILQLLPWGAFSAMRALALSRSRPLSILVFLLSITPMGVNFYLFRYGMDGKVDPLTGCQMHQEIHIPHELTIKFTSISRSSFILCDIMLIVITWCSLFRRRLFRAGVRSSLARILLLDGTIYFILLLIMNTLQITFTFLSIFGTGGASGMSSFTEPVTGVLVSRFLLDLQEASRCRDTSDGDLENAPRFSTCQTSTSGSARWLLGSLDSTIMFGLSEDVQMGSEVTGIPVTNEGDSGKQGKQGNPQDSA